MAVSVVSELDVTRPPTPDELLKWSASEIDFDPTELVELLDEHWNEILRELQDARFHGRTHERTGTYEAGCRGVLCRKANRENPRRRTEPSTRVLSPRLERRLDPIVEYFHTVAKLRIRARQVELLAAIRNGG